MEQKVDKNFLEFLLGEKVTSIKFAQGSKKGDNVAGALMAITVETTSGKNPTVLIKFIPPDDPLTFSYIVHFQLLEIEGEFYGSILEDLRELCDSHNVTLQLPFPKCYGHSDTFIALEDLRPSGYRMADKYVGLNALEASCVLTSLASFHALTYVLIRENGEQVFQKKELRQLMLEFPWNPKVVGDGYLKTSDMLRDVIEVMAEQNQDYANKLEKLLPQFHPLFLGIWKDTNEKYFPVLCHGDFWINNFLFKYNASSEPIDVKFIDMQQVHRGNIYEDLSYFFITSTTPKFRAEYLKPSLQAYYTSFVETVTKFGCPVPSGFSFESLIENYLSTMKTMAVFVGGAIAFQLGGVPSGQDETSGEIIDREDKKEDKKNEEIILRKQKPEELIPANQLYDDLGLFCQMNLKGEPRAVQRFVDVIEEFDGLGVFN